MDTNRTPYHHGDLRAALLVAGEKVLAETGVEGFSLRRVAREVGVSHAAPAHHFGDAPGLLAALSAEGFRRFTDAMEARQGEARAHGADDPQGLVLASALGYLDFAEGSPALFRLMFSGPFDSAASSELAEAARAAFDHLDADITRLRGAPAMATPEGRADVCAVWSMVHGFASLVISRRMSFVDGGREMRDTMLRDLISRAQVSRDD